MRRVGVVKPSCPNFSHVADPRPAPSARAWRDGTADRMMSSARPRRARHRPAPPTAADTTRDNDVLEWGQRASCSVRPLEDDAVDQFAGKPDAHPRAWLRRGIHGGRHRIVERPVQLRNPSNGTRATGRSAMVSRVCVMAPNLRDGPPRKRYRPAAARRSAVRSTRPTADRRPCGQVAVGRRRPRSGASGPARG